MLNTIYLRYLLTINIRIRPLQLLGNDSTIQHTVEFFLNTPPLLIFFALNQGGVFMAFSKKLDFILNLKNDVSKSALNQGVGYL